MFSCHTRQKATANILIISVKSVGGDISFKSPLKIPAKFLSTYSSTHEGRNRHKENSQIRLFIVMKKF